MILRSIAAIVSVVLLLALGLLWLLSQGPVSVAFLIPYLQGALSHGEAGVEASIDDALVLWNREEERLDLQAVNVVLRSREGETLARVPDLSVRLSVPPLLQGRVAPTALDVSGIQARVLRDASGAFSLGFWSADSAPAPAESGQARESQSGETMMALIARNTAPGGNLSELRTIGIRNADITLFDEGTGSLWRSPRSNLVLARDGETIRAELRLGVELGDSLVALRGDGRYRPADGALDSRAEFSGLDLSALARKVPALVDLAGAHVPVDGRIAFSLGADRRLSPIDLEASAGGGRIVAPGLKEAIALTAASVRGQLAGDFSRLRLDAVKLDSAGMTVEAAGTVTLAGGLGLAIQGDLRNLSVDRLGALWPEHVASGGRRWVLANVRGGTVPHARFRASLTPQQIASGAIPAEAVSVEFDIARTSVAYQRPMPALTGVDAVARLDPKRLEITVRAGQAGEVVLTDGKVTVSGLSEKDQFADISFAANGEARAVLRLIDAQPLALVRKVGLNPDTVGGAAEVSTKLRMVLEDRIRLDDIVVQSEAKIKGLSIPAARDGIDLSAGELTLTADAKRLAANGTAALNGVPVRLAWREEFDASKPFTSRYDVAGELDDAGRKSLGFDTGAFVTGPAQVDVVVQANARGSALVEAKLDFAKSKLDAPPVYWSKEPGIAAKGDITARFEPGRPAAIDVALTAPDASVKARIALVDNAFSRIDIASISLPALAGSGFVERTRDGGWRFDFSGPNADLTRFLDDAMSGPSGPKTGPAIAGTLKFDRATMAEKVDVTGFSALARLDRGEIKQLAVHAALPPTGQFALDVKPEGQRRKLSLTSSDASAVMRFLGIGDTKGGAFQLTGEFEDDRPGQPLKARALINNVTVTDAPLLARLLAVGSLTGIGNLLTSEGISFSRAEIPFTLQGDELKLEGARANGSSLGLTAEGTIDVEKKTLALNGAVAPVYFLNSLLGNIPLVGPLLEGRKGEGVFAFTYRIDGPYDDPGVTVNPVSILAPGILRRLFELRSAPSHAPPEPAPSTDR
jgi:hypothetical protein